MSPWDLTPAAQYWVLTVLVWVGFGSLAGLVVRAVVPLEEPGGPAGTIFVGVVGSAVGLLILALLSPERSHHPFSPVGFAAAVGGALVVLALYQMLARLGRPREVDEGEEE